MLCLSLLADMALVGWVKRLVVRDAGRSSVRTPSVIYFGDYGPIGVPEHGLWKEGY